MSNPITVQMLTTSAEWDDPDAITDDQYGLLATLPEPVLQHALDEALRANDMLWTELCHRVIRDATTVLLGQIT